MAHVPGHPSDPRERFVERLLVLRGDRDALTTTYGPPDAAPNDRIATLNALWNNAEQIDEHVACLHSLQPTDLVDLGIRLGWVALPGIVREAFLDDLDAAQAHGRRLRLWLHDDDSGLGDLPWEYLYLEETSSGFLGLHPACSIVRDCSPADAERGAAIEAWLSPDEPIRILLVYADPPVSGLHPIAAAPLLDRVRRHLDQLTWPTQVTTLLPHGHSSDSSLVASRKNFERQMCDGAPHVVFLVAHGVFDDSRTQGVAYLESDDPGAFDEVSADDFSRMVRAGQGPFVFLLNVCWSAFRGSSGAGHSLARALCGPGRGVVSMQFAWPAAADTLFWNTFFSALAGSSPLDDCLFEAREMLMRGAPNTPDWGCPVLHRHGTVRPGPAPIVHKPRLQLDLMLVRDLLTGREREMVDAVLNLLPALQSRGDIAAIRQFDPLFLVLAGEPDEESNPVTTSPVWFSTLLEPPARFEWRTMRRGPWWLSVWVAGGDDLVHRQVDDPHANVLPDETRRWPRGVLIRWHVKRDASPGRRGPTLVRGAFRIAGADDAVRRPSLSPSGVREDVSPAAAPEALLRDGLYDDLFRQCAAQMVRRPPASWRFVLHRLQAEASVEMQRQLSLLDIGHPEGIWAAALARQHVEGGYRAIAGTHLRMET